MEFILFESRKDLKLTESFSWKSHLKWSVQEPFLYSPEKWPSNLYLDTWICECWLDTKQNYPVQILPFCLFALFIYAELAFKNPVVSLLHNQTSQIPMKPSHELLFALMTGQGPHEYPFLIMRKIWKHRFFYPSEPINKKNLWNLAYTFIHSFLFTL